ncbi:MULTISPECIES: alpha/beta hydrolase [Staphylococcus]|uniref:alpha/beta hydrolase n=1 Tax=Staphylococcus TaxID=1279 RepID=UPI001D13CAC7|nr:MULTISPECIES: alpha/beta hydrolase [Staphylococcus]MCC3711894.1 alpha/beta hydrolase [Staphylococcus hominis]MCC3713672.1 alpha/beta hydrolase [Staphylococcus hominis]MCC3737455.1 alpha/beta hydrolase [Staphylococcus hominis]MDS3858983.1 alpha/beta hydrolase [Staphylococcus hominis]MDS3871893.1 alpha/beta hydrolase [Staphylococcus hominis]
MLVLKNKEYNFVAHSMGNLSFTYFMKSDDHHPPFPTLNKKEVNIVRTYNGVLNLNEKVNEIQVDQNGKPNKMSEDDKK